MSSSFIIERMLEADTKAKESSKARLDGQKRWSQFIYFLTGLHCIYMMGCTLNSYTAQLF